MTIEENMRQLGVSNNAATVYTAALKYDSCKVKELSSETGLVRQLVYEAISELVNKGLLTKEPIGKNRYKYIPNSPEVLKDILRQKEKDIDKILPELDRLYKTKKMLPRVKVLENNAQCRQALRNLLEEFNNDKEVYVISEIGRASCRERV